MIKNRLGILTLVLILSIMASGCGTKKETVTKSGFYFNTIIQITLYDSTKESLMEDCFSMAETYENLFSRTKEGSDIYRINHADGQPVEVSHETIQLLEKGLSYCEISNGAFDITLGKLSDLWDIPNNSGVIPKQTDLDEACSHTGYQKVKISNQQVQLTDPDAEIDLGAIAKGYIADQMKSYLNQQGITEGFINLGGNVLTLGEKENSSTYKIGVQKPFSREGEVLLSVEIADGTVVSSGIYERFFQLNDTIYHHILNPADGYPYQNGLYAVTIICNDSVDGDGLSTTCFALGMEKGLEFIESLPDTEAIFITDQYEIITSSGMGTDIPYTVY